jgi:uncharacterized repeat protein (TIGR01451 family)
MRTKASPYRGRREEKIVANTIRRTVAAVPLWAVGLLLAAAFAVAAVATFGAGGARAQVEGSADLTVTKTVQPSLVTVGDRQTFTIKVTNARRDTAREVHMTDRLPDQVRFIRASTSRQVPGSCGRVRQIVLCDLGKLRVGRTVTVQIFVEATQAGRYINRVFVNHSTTELDHTDNRDDVQARAT